MAENKILTVSQTNELIRMLLEGNPLLKRITVSGEITNLTVHRTGHLYFSLKDESAVLRAVMFRTAASKLKFLPEDGLKVLASGRITVYPASGAYQIVVEDLIPDGIGELQLAFEQRKRRLSAEGLFDASRKRPLPRLPRRVGVITSPTGAAIRDILQISERRFPFASVVLFPALVQGEGAAAQLREGLAVMNRQIKPDLIIIGRGGGSAEDLWAFNDEGLVRDVAASAIPVISAVGHEIDFTLCDFAADLRAPTPSAAAELAFPDMSEMLRRFDNVKLRMAGCLSAELVRCQRELARLSNSRAMTRPIELIRERHGRLCELGERMERAAGSDLIRRQGRLASLAELLDAVSPLRTLARGFSAVTHPDGGLIRSVRDLKIGDAVRIRMADGTVDADVSAAWPLRHEGEEHDG